MFTKSFSGTIITTIIIIIIIIIIITTILITIIIIDMNESVLIYYYLLLLLLLLSLIKHQKKLEWRSGVQEDGELLILRFQTSITERLFMCLRPLTWLNDEIINFYMNLLNSYDERLCERFPNRKKSHFFSSFFVTRLLNNRLGYVYNEVTNWAKKLDVFAMDKFIMPINTNNNHWTLACVYIAQKQIHYFDTYKKRYEDIHKRIYVDKSADYMEGLIKWVIDEGKKRNVTEKRENWELINRTPDIPQQENDYDCGVFTIVCADFLSDNLPLKYSQKDMPFWR